MRTGSHQAIPRVQSVMGWGPSSHLKRGRLSPRRVGRPPHTRNRAKPPNSWRKATFNIQIQFWTFESVNDPIGLCQAKKVCWGPSGVNGVSKPWDIRKREIHEGKAQEDHRSWGQAHSEIVKWDECAQEEARGKPEREVEAQRKRTQ